MKLFLSLLLLGTLASADFPGVMAEPNLEKRSDLALLEADRAITVAKKSYEERNVQDFKARVGEAGELVDLSYKSLQDSGKRARRNPKYFKRAEHGIRALMRRLDTLAAEVALEDRGFVIAAHKQLSEVHDDVVDDIMTKK